MRNPSGGLLIGRMRFCRRLCMARLSGDQVFAFYTQYGLFLDFSIKSPEYHPELELPYVEPIRPIQQFPGVSRHSVTQGLVFEKSWEEKERQENEMRNSLIKKVFLTETERW